jgi:hypothetical protein
MVVLATAEKRFTKLIGAYVTHLRQGAIGLAELS